MIQPTDHHPSIPPVDGRTRIRHGTLAYDLPAYRSLAAWEARAAHLRRRVLTAAGLWPTPERCALRPRVTGRVEHEDYTIENVFFESWPGFYVCGNLYRPKGAGSPAPGVLCPHGHWAHGRLQDIERGSIPARCITLARQGTLAFAYDMIGYNDSGIQIAGRVTELDDGGPDEGPHKRHFHSPRHFLWGASLLGLQLWNSVRALDYLASLPDVDAARLACTGASGGGTQTFLLCAIDERVRVAAPVNMISAHFQGGCACENAPNLRLDCTNVEFAALMAPRPLLMVSATGDWTVNTPQVEYPAVRAIYALYGAEDRVATVQVDAPHNYNRESREAVYAWFGRWLLGVDDPEALRERPYQVDPPERMRVFRSETRHSEGSGTCHSSLPPVAQNDRAEGVAWNGGAPEGGVALPTEAATPGQERGMETAATAAAATPGQERGMETAATAAAATPGQERSMETAATVAVLPEEAVTPEQLTEHWIGQAKAQIQAMQPRDAATLHAYRETMGMAYRYALNARLPQASELRVERVSVEERAGKDGMPAHRLERLVLGRREAGERTPGLLYMPRDPVGAVLVVHPEGVEGAISVAQGALLHRLLAHHLAVLTLDAWGTGALAGLERDKSVDHFLCFNRSDAALRVQDVLNGVAVLSAGAILTAPGSAPGTGAGSKNRGDADVDAQNAPGTGAQSNVRTGAGSNVRTGDQSDGEVRAQSGGEVRAASRILPVHLVGLGRAGLWCLLARALCGAGCGAGCGAHVARTVVDAAQFACDDDQAWLDALYLPHIRRAGDLRTAAALTVPGALYVHNAAPDFPFEFARQAYRAAGAPDALHIQAEPADAEAIVGWLTEPPSFGLKVSG